MAGYKQRTNVNISLCLAAVAGYNKGMGSAGSWDFSRIDSGTTGGDYSNDVMARAKYLKNNHGWS